MHYYANVSIHLYLKYIFLFTTKQFGMRVLETQHHLQKTFHEHASYPKDPYPSLE